MALRPRQLPTAYLYDDLGSALFEAICQLPWYHLTRAETGLLTRHAGDIAAATGDLGEIIELGPGCGEKIAMLLSGMSAEAKPHIHLIDVSPAALRAADKGLQGLGHTAIICHQATYHQGLDSIAQQAPQGRRLIIMLGSNIGNFSPAQRQDLLGAMAHSLTSNDYLLLGLDLIKGEQQLQLAYHDPLGVTEAFNRNLLQRINRELGADFQQDRFRYGVTWNAEQRRVESYLYSICQHTVHIPGAGLTLKLEADEGLWSESSYKFDLDDCHATLAELGFSPTQHWLDPQAQYALILLRRSA